MIKEQGITDGAAVASARAAEIYGMKILAKSIEDNQSKLHPVLPPRPRGFTENRER